MYRAAVNNDGVIVCIGMDENQSGAYHDMGEWCDFTFDSIPAISEELSLLASEGKVSLLKVVNDEVVVRTVEEVEAELNA